MIKTLIINRVLDIEPTSARIKDNLGYATLLSRAMGSSIIKKEIYVSKPKVLNRNSFPV